MCCPVRALVIEEIGASPSLLARFDAKTTGTDIPTNPAAVEAASKVFGGDLSFNSVRNDGAGSGTESCDGGGILQRKPQEQREAKATGIGSAGRAEKSTDPLL